MARMLLREAQGLAAGFSLALSGARTSAVPERTYTRHLAPTEGARLKKTLGFAAN